MEKAELCFVVEIVVSWCMPQKSNVCNESPTKAPSFVVAFVENLYTKVGFRADSWQNSGSFMPRKGYDSSTKKISRIVV